MKRKGMLNKALLAIVSIMVTGMVFTGCSSASSSNNATTETTASASSNTNDNSSSTDSNAPANDMKSSFQTAINELVSAGTINSDQGTKILEALTSRGDRMQGNKPDGEEPSGDKSNAKQTSEGSSSSDSKPSGGRMNPLSKLVEDNTITQAQADAVMEKVQGIMPQGGKHNNDNSNNSTNNNSNSNSNSNSSNNQSS